jgi:hypothetical protein
VNEAPAPDEPRAPDGVPALDADAYAPSARPSTARAAAWLGAAAALPTLIVLGGLLSGLDGVPFAALAQAAAVLLGQAALLCLAPALLAHAWVARAERPALPLAIALPLALAAVVQAWRMTATLAADTVMALAAQSAGGVPTSFDVAALMADVGASNEMDWALAAADASRFLGPALVALALAHAAARDDAPPNARLLRGVLRLGGVALLARALSGPVLAAIGA